MIWRVRGRVLFAALARAHPTRGRGLVLRSVDLGDGAPPRVALAVGRAVGNAVARNRVRRRVRAAIREHADLEAGRAYLLGVSPEAARMSAAELGRAIAAVFERAGR